MKRTFAGLGAALALVLLGSTALAAEKKAAASKHKAKPALVMKTPDDLKWVPNPGAPDQVSMAVVSGDPDKGPHKAFHKFKVLRDGKPLIDSEMSEFKRPEKLDAKLFDKP